MNPIVSYIIFGVLIAILIVGGILVRTKRFSGKKRYFRKAVRLKQSESMAKWWISKG